MKIRKISFKNFFIGTTANFLSIEKKELPQREPDFESKSGSQYWYEGKSVYRYSSHFNRSVASCSWFLDNASYQGRYKAGVCLLTDFLPNECEMFTGERYTVYFAPKDRKGVETLYEFTDTFKEMTYQYYIFNTRKVSLFTFLAVAPKTKENATAEPIYGFNERLVERNLQLQQAKQEQERQYARMFKFAFEGKKSAYTEWKKLIESSGSSATLKKRKAEYLSNFGVEYKSHFDKEVKELLK